MLAESSEPFRVVRCECGVLMELILALRPRLAKVTTGIGSPWARLRMVRAKKTGRRSEPAVIDMGTVDWCVVEW